MAKALTFADGDVGSGDLPPHLLLLNGPAGVGKTTVARHLAAVLPGTVWIQGDVLRSFAPTSAAEQLGAGSTYRAGAAPAAEYLRMGAARVVFDYVFEGQAALAHFTDRMTGLAPVHLVTLWAPLDVVLRRDASRAARHGVEARVRACHRTLARNLPALGRIVETAGLSPKRVAAAVDRVVRRCEGSMVYGPPQAEPGSDWPKTGSRSRRDPPHSSSPSPFRNSSVASVARRGRAK